MKSLIERANLFFEDPRTVAATHLYTSSSDLGKIDFFDILPNKKKRKIKKSKAKLTLDKVLETEPTTLGFISSEKHLKPSNGQESNERYVKSMEYSHWNPPPQRRRIIGDFFYLKVVTLEGDEFHITAFSKGFYINKCTDSHFDPTADSELFFNIIDVISHKSSSFSGKVGLGLFDSLNLEVKHIDLPANQRPTQWIRTEEEIEEHDSNGYRATKNIYSTYGYNPVIYRDWNEEMINSRVAPEDDIFGRMNQKKSEIRTNSAFLDAAIEGAKAIIDGELTPFNAFVPVAEQCFIHNNIFFTYAVDEYMRLVQQKGDDSLTSLAVTNSDLRNISILVNNGYNKLHTINTALIYYKGRVVVAQTMIQGILHFDQETWSKYGSSDGGKTIFNDEEFSTAIKEINQIFSIKDEHTFIDKEGKEVSLNSASDIKGIIGGDRRKYILEVMRLSPRDLNWSQENTPEEYSACVLRLGILKTFIMNKRVQVIHDVKSRFTKEIEDNKQENLASVQASINEKKEKKAMEIQDNIDPSNTKVDLSEEERQKIDLYNKNNAEISQKIDDAVKQDIESKGLEDYRVNPVFLTNATNYQIKDEEKDSDLEVLNEIAKFAKESMTTRVAQDWSRLLKMIPIDSESLGIYLHKFGLNIRYIGYLIERLPKATHPAYYITVKRTILVRALKHFINRVIRSTDIIQLSPTLIHILNSILCDQVISDRISKQIKDINDGLEKSEGSHDSDKKKKKKTNKKKRKNLKQVDCDLHPNIFLMMNPKQIFEEVKKIAEYRYHYKFEENYFYQLEFCDSNVSLLSLLREITKSSGIVMRLRTYSFRGAHTKQNDKSSFPLQDIDIIGFDTRIKSTHISFKEVSANLELAQSALSQQNFDVALEMFQYALNMIINVNGPFTSEAIDCAMNLSTVIALKGNLDQAISMQKIIFTVAEKTFGLDNINMISIINDLGSYYESNKSTEKAIECYLKSLYLADLIGGEFNAESLKLLEELQGLYVEVKDFQQAIKCCHEKKERISRLYSPHHQYILTSYQKLASLYFQLEDYEEALECAKKKLRLLEQFHKDTLRSEILRTVKEIELIKQKIQTGGSTKDSTLQIEKEELSNYKERVKALRTKKGRKHF